MAARRKGNMAAERVRQLGTARIVCLATSFGLSVAAVCLLGVGIAYLFTGDFRIVGFARPFAVNAGIVALLVGMVLPVINKMLLREARTAPGPDLSIPLLEIAAGLPLGALGAPVGEELARSLRAADAAWWRENAGRMAPKVRIAFTSLENPTKLTLLDSPWIPALFDAMARCGRTEFLGRLERLESRWARADRPRAARESLSECTAALRDTKRKEREAATLLRVAEAGEDGLLRPAGDSRADSEELLRAVDKAGPVEAPVAISPAYQTADSTQPEELNALSVRS